MCVGAKRAKYGTIPLIELIKPDVHTRPLCLFAEVVLKHPAPWRFLLAEVSWQFTVILDYILAAKTKFHYADKTNTV